MTNVTYDSVVVGAGPYGLSVTAHLRARGLRVTTFGKPMGLWRDHMPRGMLLRSHWWATNLSDPEGKFGFRDFYSSTGRDVTHPVPLQTFVEYGLWFAERAVPDVDPTFVRMIERQGTKFLVSLTDGRELLSRTIVMAVGPRYYAHRPAQFAGLSPERLSHSCDHGDYGRFSGQRVIVVGGGQSAIEYAALLHEAGADVEVLSRRRLMWLGPDTGERRLLRDRVRRPDASIAPGWKNWVLDHAPYLFYRFPQPWKDSYNADYRSGSSHWLRDRIIGKVSVREEEMIVSVAAVDGKVEARLSDDSTTTADHIMLATGFRVDLACLPMLHPSLQARIRHDNSIPLLDGHFGASVPGIYFIGLTSLRAFGPLFRFVAGCGAAARRVASAVART